MKRIALYVLIVSLLSLPIFFQLTGASAIEKQINENLSEIMENIEVMATRNPELAASSNPYDYINENNNYNNIVQIGQEAIPVIEKNINSSKENGLQEYILAIAAEEIAKVDLRENRYNWSNAKEWASVWNKYLKETDSLAEEILSSDQAIEFKIERLKKLGTPAIPFIVERVEAGNIEFVPALEELLDETDSENLKKNNSKDDYVRWAQENKPKFKNLRQLLEN